MTINEKLKIVRQLLEECEAEATENTEVTMRIHKKTLTRVQINTIKILANRILYKMYPECFNDEQNEKENAQ
jgi:hypothetical protein